MRPTGKSGPQPAGGSKVEPDLEVVQIRPGESFAAWSHGYPFRTVRWHFHPEYELHLVVATRGRYFVGDFIGEFEPGNLVLTGPNLPHNWVSDIPKGTTVPLRCRIVQFTEQFIAGMQAALPELAALQPLLERSRRGVLFSQETSRAGRAAHAGTDGCARRSPHRAVSPDLRDAQPRPACQGAGQRQLPARPVGLHVGRDQQGAGLSARAILPSRSPKRTLQRSPVSRPARSRAPSASTPACRWCSM